MALRSLLACMIAVQALAGCGVPAMPAKSAVTYVDAETSQRAELAARDARTRIQLRSQVEAGTLGLAQLFPGGMPIDARQLPPLPRPMAVAIPVVLPSVAQPSPFDKPTHVVLASAAGRSGGCVYKPIMSDADIDACR